MTLKALIDSYILVTIDTVPRDHRERTADLHVENIDGAVKLSASFGALFVTVAGNAVQINHCL